MIFHYAQRNINLELLPPILIVNNPITRCEEFNFLGLIVQQNLKWKSHIAHISTKISRATGILKRLQNTLPTDILKTIYNSLILPHLLYCILAWGHSCSRIVLLQKKAIRIINKGKYNSHTAPLFKTSKLLTVTDIFIITSLKFYYKYCHKNVPTYFINMFRPNHNHTPYLTRYRDNPLPQAPLHSSSLNALRYTTPEIVSTMPDIVTFKIKTHSYPGFSFYVKHYLINKYIDVCTIRNCYICNANNTI